MDITYILIPAICIGVGIYYLFPHCKKWLGSKTATQPTTAGTPPAPKKRLESMWCATKSALKFLTVPFVALTVLVIINIVGGFLFPAWWGFIQTGMDAVKGVALGDIGGLSPTEKLFLGIQVAGFILILLAMSEGASESEAKKWIATGVMLAVLVGLYTHSKMEVIEITAKPGEWTRVKLNPMRTGGSLVCKTRMIVYTNKGNYECSPETIKDEWSSGIDWMKFHPESKEPGKATLTITYL